MHATNRSRRFRIHPHGWPFKGAAAGPLDLLANLASLCLVGRAPVGPCFKPINWHIPTAAGHQEVDTSAWPPALTPSLRGQASARGSLRGRRTPACDRSSKAGVLPPRGAGTSPADGKPSITPSVVGFPWFSQEIRQGDHCMEMEVWSIRYSDERNLKRRAPHREQGDAGKGSVELARPGMATREPFPVRLLISRWRV